MTCKGFVGVLIILFIVFGSYFTRYEVPYESRR
jgi:hypothetical protein